MEKKDHIFDRAKDEWYVEPIWVTLGLLEHVTFFGGVWDPACGGGNILSACDLMDIESIGTDIVDRGKATRLIDFLSYDGPPLAPNIIMNPPFGKSETAELFIRKALSVAKEKVATFVDQRFLGSSRRAGGLFKEHRPLKVFQITPRPSCPPGDWLEAGGKPGGGTADYVWIVWDSVYPEDATMFDWMRCDRA